MINLKEDWSLIFFILILGVLIGLLIGFYRASVHYQGIAQIKEFSFNMVISSTDGNITNLERLHKPFSCIVFNNKNITTKFYQEILVPSLQEKPVCFKGS